MPAYIPPHLRKKGVEKTKQPKTKKQLRFPSNTTGESSRNVSFAPLSKLFSGVYKVFSSALQTRKLRRKPLSKVLKTGKKGALRAQSLSPPKKTMKQKRPASV